MWRHRRDIDVPIRELVAVLEQQPLVPPLAVPAANLYQRPLPEHFFPVKPERELARCDRLHRIVARLDEFPPALIPDDDVPRSVVSFRNHPFE